MIIQLFMTVIYNLTELFTRPITIPAPNDDVIEVINNVFYYIQSGLGILANYVNIPLLFGLLGIIIVIDVAIGLYHFIMWILKKIPVASIS